MVTRKNKKESGLIPDIHKIEELKSGRRKLTPQKENKEEVRRTGPKTTRKEEKDPNEYPMK